ncbi:MEC3 DNA damage checkpoint control protein MEC3 [Candida maltosa Xu316]
MKLKLLTRSPEKLRETLSLISHLRKFVILKFTPQELTVISVNGQTVSSEPQVWCKLPVDSLFETVDIHSVRDNVVMMEINIDLLIQTLKNFDKANSEGLNIRLQRTEASGNLGMNTKTGRTASLALFYANLNINANVVNHTFKIPIKIQRDALDLLHEPTHPDVGLIMKLPNEFVTMFKRLEKFKRTPSSDTVTIRASRRNGGFLGFILEEEGKFKVTISWNNKLEVQKHAISEHESLRETIRHLPSQSQEDEDEELEDGQVEEIDLNLKLKDWQQASKIVGRCRTVVLYIYERECSLHCLLDDTDDVEIAYFINGSKIIH